MVFLFQSCISCLDIEVSRIVLLRGDSDNVSCVITWNPNVGLGTFTLKTEFLITKLLVEKLFKCYEALNWSYVFYSQSFVSHSWTPQKACLYFLWLNFIRTSSSYTNIFFWISNVWLNPCPWQCFVASSKENVSLDEKKK